MQENKFCVYLHRRKTDGEVFYVGQGTLRRANTTRRCGRSQDYGDVLKTYGVTVQIVERNLSKEIAEILEQDLILLLLDMDIHLVNKQTITSKSKTIYGKDYPELVYSESIPGNLAWAEDRYCGNSQSRFLKVKAGQKAATRNKTTGYYLFRNTVAHRIVYALINGECPADKQVNHIDGDKTNNKISNLELATPSENIQHSYDIGLNSGRPGTLNPMAFLTDEIVLEIYKLFEEGLDNEAIGDKYGMTFKHVSLLRHGSRWRHLYDKHGHKFKRSKKEIVNTRKQIKEAWLLCKTKNLTNKEISNITGVEVSQISRLRSGKAFLQWVKEFESEDVQ